MECKQCGTEYTSKRATSQYCSPACRVNANRNKVSVTPLSVTDVSVTDNRKEQPRDEALGEQMAEQIISIVESIPKRTKQPCKDMSRIEIQQAIKAYPYDQWINSLEHKEFMSRLHTRTIEQLEADGY